MVARPPGLACFFSPENASPERQHAVQAAPSGDARRLGLELHRALYPGFTLNVERKLGPVSGSLPKPSGRGRRGVFLPGKKAGGAGFTLEIPPARLRPFPLLPPPGARHLAGRPLEMEVRKPVLPSWRRV